MAAPTNHWKLGLFVVSGVVLLLAGIAALGARSLHTETVSYVSYFDESVQGLDVGSPIKFRGVTIGNVGAIEVAPDHREVEVRSDLVAAELTRLGLDVDPASRKKLLRIAPDLRVQLASAGLTGVKFLQLDFFVEADNPPPVLPFPVPENYIPAAASTMKNLEDSLVRAVHKMPELTDQLSVILAKVDFVLGDVKDQGLPAKVVETLKSANLVLTEAHSKIEQVDTRRLSAEAQRSLEGLSEALQRTNGLLARIDGDKGLLASVTRASDALGDTVRGADGLGNQLEDALGSVQTAAKSIQKLADALQKDPDMLLKGRTRGPEKNR